MSYDTLQVYPSKELCSRFDCKWLKAGSVLSLNQIISRNKLWIKFKTGNSLSTSTNGVYVELSDNSLSSSTAKKHVTKFIKIIRFKCL